MRKLPSLTGLRAFEAAARCASFTAAAVELHVTQTAVSRSVKLLEGQLGCRLFERRANSLALTDQGRILLPELTAAFDLLASATRRTATASARPVLTVGVGPTFAMRWLIPRLGRFQQLHPGIEVHTTTGGARAALRRVLRVRAAGGARRRRCRNGPAPVCRRRSRRRPVGGALPAGGREAPGLASRAAHRVAR